MIQNPLSAEQSEGEILNLPRYRPHHTAISVRDLATSLSFYTGLGFEEINRAEFDGATLVHLQLEEYALELFAYEKNRQLPPLTPGFGNDLDVLGIKHLALATDDIQGTLADLCSRGLADESIEIGALPDGKAQWVFIQDPDGLWVEFIQEDRFSIYSQPWSDSNRSSSQAVRKG
ncbi:VOC family protein [Arthrobacter globiformis]|uniref:VOC family protein n=1 Tax=Arthrobacter globiformis TaxID=1665 RepID=UPI00278B2839|nr:VOC family protein [Arthrobacter globiformis]MDQ0867315.1 lactoylglutathione lyase [Arthrobacter globiformis]